MIVYLFKVLASSTAFWLIYKIFLQKDTFFERNRVYLLASTMLSFLLPLVNWQTWWGANEVPSMLPLSTTFLQEIQIGTETTKGVFQINWIAALPHVALFISVAYLLYIAFGIWKLVQLANTGKKERHPNYTLVQVNKRQYPFSFLNYLFWGNTQQFSEQESRKILQHELAHINGKHSYDIILMELVCAICWMNPFFFLFKNYLKEQHEYIADAAVYKQGEKSNYARLMVQNTLKSLDLGTGFLPTESIQLSHNFYQSPILKRLEMMNKSRTPIVKSLKLLVIIPALVALTFMYACEGVETTESIVEDLVKKSDLDAALVKTEQMYEDEVYDIVSTSAEPVGGYEAFFKYVMENMEYPKQAQSLGVEGKVYVQFIVDKDGTITDGKAVKGIGAGCDAEAIRVVTDSKKWNPAINKDGQFVKQRIILPIKFKLE